MGESKQTLPRPCCKTSRRSREHGGRAGKVIGDLHLILTKEMNFSARRSESIRGHEDLTIINSIYPPYSIQEQLSTCGIQHFVDVEDDIFS